MQPPAPVRGFLRTAALSLLKQEVSRMIRYAFLSSLYVVSLLALTLAYSFIPT